MAETDAVRRGEAFLRLADVAGTAASPGARGSRVGGGALREGRPARACGPSRGGAVHRCPPERSVAWKSVLAFLTQDEDGSATRTFWIDPLRLTCFGCLLDDADIDLAPILRAHRASIPIIAVDLTKIVRRLDSASSKCGSGSSSRTGGPARSTSGSPRTWAASPSASTPIPTPLPGSSSFRRPRCIRLKNRSGPGRGRSEAGKLRLLPPGCGPAGGARPRRHRGLGARAIGEDGCQGPRRGRTGPAEGPVVRRRFFARSFRTIVPSHPEGAPTCHRPARSSSPTAGRGQSPARSSTRSTPLRRPGPGSRSGMQTSSTRSARSLHGAGFEIRRLRFAVARRDARMFATMDLETSLARGVSLAVGIRNSTDKSLPLGFCAGSRVFVCDNLAFRSELLVHRKHTRFGEERFQEEICEAVTALDQFRVAEAARIEPDARRRDRRRARRVAHPPRASRGDRLPSPAPGSRPGLARARARGVPAEDGLVAVQRLHRGAGTAAEVEPAAVRGAHDPALRACSTRSRGRQHRQRQARRSRSWSLRALGPSSARRRTSTPSHVRSNLSINSMEAIVSRSKANHEGNGRSPKSRPSPRRRRRRRRSPRRRRSSRCTPSG